MSLEDTLIDKVNTLVTTAFGFVAALAWNEAIKGLIERLGLKVYGPWVYAVSVTVLAVIATLVIGKFAERAKRLDIDEKVGRQLKKRAEEIKKLKQLLKKK